MRWELLTDSNVLLHLHLSVRRKRAHAMHERLVSI